MYSNVEFRACSELAELYCRKGVNHEPPHQSGDLPQEPLDATKHGIAITACRLGARVFSVLGSSISSSQTMKFAATCVNSEEMNFTSLALTIWVCLKIGNRNTYGYPRPSYSHLLEKCGKFGLEPIGIGGILFSK